MKNVCSYFSVTRFNFRTSSVQSLFNIRSCNDRNSSKSFFNKYSKNQLVILFFGLALLLQGCVTLVPDYDESITEQISETAKLVDRFYLEMLETTSIKNGGRSYDKFADSYVDIEVELKSLLYKNKVRPLNENSIKICEITLNLWSKYKEEHKEDNEISDGLIKINMLYFDDLFYAMQVAEEAKKIIINQTE